MNDEIKDLDGVVITLTVGTKQRGKDFDMPMLDIEFQGNKIFARTRTSNSIEAKIDITPVWSFFKQVQEYSKQPALDQAIDIINNKNE